MHEPAVSGARWFKDKAKKPFTRSKSREFQIQNHSKIRHRNSCVGDHTRINCSRPDPDHSERKCVPFGNRPRNPARSVLEQADRIDAELGEFAFDQFPGQPRLRLEPAGTGEQGEEGK